MKITALEEYGLRCMILLARSESEPLTLPEISAREGLSLPYAGKLLMILKQAGLTRAARGRRGGYILARSPQQIPLKEIFQALGEPVYGPNHCRRYIGEKAHCIHNEDCTARAIWKTVSDFIDGYLGGMSLADLADRDSRLAPLAGLPPAGQVQ